MTSNEDLAAAAETIIIAAGNLLQKKVEKPRELTHKGFRDIVTDADFASQRFITQELHRRFPGHGFITEEDDDQIPSSGEVIWIIDPIDGTSNFSRQIPNYSIAIAAGRPVNDDLQIDVGMIYDPVRQELFCAVRGQGARLNRVPIFASQTENPQESIFSLDWSHHVETRRETIDILGVVAHHVKTVRAVGSAALAIAWVAAGRLDGYMNIHLFPWDVAAAALIAAEAGGRVTNFYGEDWHFRQMDCLVSNGKLHDTYLNLIREGQIAALKRTDISSEQER